MGNGSPGTAPTERSLGDGLHYARPPPPRQRKQLFPVYSTRQRAMCKLRRINSSAATGPSTLNQVEHPDAHRRHRTGGVLGYFGGKVARLDAREHDVVDHPLLPVPMAHVQCRLVGGVEAADPVGPDERLRLPVHMEPQQRFDNGVERATGSPPASATACSERVSRSIIVRSSSPAAVTA